MGVCEIRDEKENIGNQRVSTNDLFFRANLLSTFLELFLVGFNSEENGTEMI